MVRERLQERVEEVLENTAANPSFDWDTVLLEMTRAVRKESKVEKVQAARLVKELKARGCRAPPSTRVDLIDANSADADAKDEFWHGAFLHASTKESRYFFQRVSNWSRSQSITDLVLSIGSRTNGKNLAAAWASIFG